MVWNSKNNSTLKNVQNAWLINIVVGVHDLMFVMSVKIFSRTLKRGQTMNDDKRKHYLMNPLNDKQMICITEGESGYAAQKPDKHIDQPWCDGMNRKESEQFNLTPTVDELREQAMKAFYASFKEEGKK